MISLMSTDDKRDLKTARRNAALVNYILYLLLIGVVTALVYSIGFWIVDKEKEAVSAQITEQTEKSKEYAKVQARAKKFRGDLKIAKSALDSGTKYSEFFMTLARDMPERAVISSISLGKTAVGASDTTDIRARVDTNNRVVELKAKLEESSLFEDVSIISVVRPESLEQLGGIEKSLPYEATYRVKISKANVKSL